MPVARTLERIFGLNRALARRLTPLVARTPLRPNHITALAMASGAAAGGMMAGGTRGGMLAGAFCLQLSFILDNCDGEIARLKDLRSRFGMWFDLTADLAVEFALWAGLALGAVRQGFSPRDAWTVCGIAMAGSALNFGRVVFEKLTAAPRQRSNGYAAAFDLLSHDGDPSVLVWFFAVLGYPGILLLLGALYILGLFAVGLWMRLHAGRLDIRDGSG